QSHRILKHTKERAGTGNSFTITNATFQRSRPPGNRAAHGGGVCRRAAWRAPQRKTRSRTDDAVRSDAVASDQQRCAECDDGLGYLTARGSDRGGYPADSELFCGGILRCEPPLPETCAGTAHLTGA